MKMLKAFLKNGLSAAGISHVVTAKSLFRRIIWIVALGIITLTMMYMTYNVLQEYLKYPVVIHKKRTSLKEMEFPAVAVCYFNIIPRHNAEEANLKYIEEMKEILESLPEYQISYTEKKRCHADPLCTWSRFLDKCFCKTTPCATTQCYILKNVSGVCACSKALCLPAVSNYTKSCTFIEINGLKNCFCKMDLEYSEHENETSPITSNFLRAVDNLDVPPKIKALLMHMKNSTDFSLRKILDFIRPNVTIRDNYGNAFENLILSCAFNGQPCNISRVADTLYSPNYGKCYMFNYAGGQNAEDKVKIVRHPGKAQGLELYLKNPKSNHIPLFSSRYGARIVVHHSKSLPFAKEKGIDIRDGDVTSIMLQYKETNRLGPPWGVCANDGDNKTSSYLKIPYDKLGCERQCRNAFIYKHCKCYHTNFLSGSNVPRRTAICNNKHESCYKTARRNSLKENCRCPPPCKEKSYEVSISAGKINEDFFKMIKMARSLKMLKNGTPAIKQPKNLGLMCLRVYFGSFTVTNITETSIYSWEFLVANIGGNLGLFLGLSLITFIEIMQFIVDLAAHTFCRKKPF